ncbi:Cytochrome P450 [Legionella massiliensis]|uniref:Cytochrome P450 n=1 Tax=Legionella massiliensis TaxID=1034943 RepID=A0A078KRZ6_9GAMM|nr:cytochrome P450 [Legionella massiliensis]CDZ77235.1 Cytochrome P450 [Legionella massiliensis]CEE12973.1 Cytochrome P450 [Legionella massiliensis]
MQERNMGKEADNNALPQMVIPQFAEYVLESVDNFFNVNFIRPVNDAYQLWQNGSEYFMSEGYERSKETGVAIIDPLPLGGVLRKLPLISRAANLVPSIYIFSGTRQNLTAIAQYGEQNKDEKARKPHDRVQEATGATTIVNQLGKEARSEKRKITRNLSSTQAFSYARMLGTNIDQFWDDELSLQDNITYIGAKIIGNCFLGISEFPKKYIRFLREANDLIADGDASSDEFADMRRKILQMSAEILSGNSDEILSKNAYASTQFESTGNESSEEMKEKLIASHSGAGFIVESNLSFLIMVALAYVSASSDIIEQLQNEVKDVDLNSPQDFEQLLFLDCIYREALRFASPTAVVPRYTSKSSVIDVVSTNGQKSSCTIYPNAYLFFAIRPIHHDPELWRNPELFNPWRFMKQAAAHELHFIGENFFPFSAGSRGCPAGNSFVEYAFKGFLVEFFKKYKLVISEPLESIPASAIHPRWKNEYYGKLEENNDVERVLIHLPGV